jgi:hypothetical protein
MIEKELTKELREGMGNPYFYDRLYAVLKEENTDLCHGDFILKIESHGIIKVLKSLGIYKTTGRASNKKNYVHPRLNLIINSTIADMQTISKTIIDMVDGKYIGIEKFNIDYSDYYLLPFRIEQIKDKYKGGYKTYLIYNPENNLTKIGMSKRVFKRYQGLCNEVSNSLKLIGYSNRDHETNLHLEYKDYRKFGEWFDLSDSMIENIINNYNFEILNLQN